MTEENIALYEKKCQKILDTLDDLDNKSSKLLASYFKLSDAHYSLGKSCLEIALSPFLASKTSLLSTGLQTIISLAEKMGENYSETRVKQTEEQAKMAKMQIGSTKKKIAGLMQKLKGKAPQELKEYKKALETHTKAQKTIESLKNSTQKDSDDPLLKFVLSIQEKNTEKLVEAKKSKEEAEKKLTEYREKVNRGIEVCNQEIDDCEASFEEALSTTIKCVLEILKGNLEQTFESEIETAKKEWVTLTTMISSDKLKTFEHFKGSVIERKPTLGLGWLWNDENMPQPVLDKVDHTELERAVKDFCEVTIQSGKDVREQAKTILQAFERLYSFQGEFVKTAANTLKDLSKHLNGNRPLNEIFKKWSEIFQKSSTEKLELHQKFCKYLDSIVLPKLRKIQAGLEGNGSTEGVIAKLIKEVTTEGELVIASNMELLDAKDKVRELKENMANLGDDNKQLEKCIDTQIVLSDQVFEKENALEARKANFIELVERKVKSIKEEANECYKQEIEKEVQICDSISGFVYFLQTFWEQSQRINAKYLSQINSVPVNEKCEELLKGLGINDIEDEYVEEEKENTEVRSEVTPSHCGSEKTEANPLPVIKVSPAMPLEKQPETPPADSSPQLAKRKFYITPLTPHKSLYAIRQDESVAPATPKSDKENSSAPTQSSSWLAKKFGVPEPLLDSFACAVSWKILLQGRLYVTKSYICFHSLFNNSTLFGGETKIVIPLSDVIQIEKRYNAWIFDNSIAIRTKNAEFFFTSFVFRNKAYDLINKCFTELKAQTKQATFEEIDNKPITVEEDKEVPKEQDELMQNLKIIEQERLERAKNIEGLVVRTNPNDILMDEEYPCPIQVLFAALHVDSHKINKKCDELGENKDLKVHEKPQHPKIFTNYKEAMGVYLKSSSEKREAFKGLCEEMPLKATGKKSYTHGLKNGLPLPFFPDHCNIDEEAAYYYISPNYVIVHKKNITKGVPYSDYFYSHFQSHIRQSVEVVQDETKVMYKTRVTNYIYNEFIKSTVFQSKIDTETVEQPRALYKDKINPLLKEYVAEEMGRFDRLMENLANSKGNQVLAYSPVLPKTGMGTIVLNEVKAKASQLQSMNRILANQKKAFSIQLFIAAVFLLFLVYILLRIHQYYFMSDSIK
eukprot:TRINITY_DN1178_c0_g1_i1.p1 TRINITY_DN1178_c0_g1~~TRINITY_DN1178_c0_g1_i1.p1  ORF type:complete len:1183 (-),score=168.57 TRINITY_DN1178_c0_g1_i1:14409-17825(-)